MADGIAPTNAHSAAYSAADRRDKANARRSELQAQLAELDHQMQAHLAQRAALVARVSQAKAGLAAADSDLSAAHKALNTARAATLIDEEPSTQEALTAAQGAVHEAKTAQETAHAAYQETIQQVAELIDEVDSALAHLQEQRSEVSQVADELGAHASRAHQEAGQDELGRLAAEYASLQEQLMAAEEALAHAQHQLDACRASVPDRLSAWPDLAASDAAILLRASGLTGAEVIARRLCDYIAALITYAGAASPTIGQLSLKLAVQSLDERTVERALLPSAGQQYTGPLRHKLDYARKVLAMIHELSTKPAEVRQSLAEIGAPVLRPPTE